jgi:hypothetical protein
MRVVPLNGTDEKGGKEMFDLFKKKPTSDEMQTKILISQKKLEKREAQLKDRRDKARAEAKEALAKGDERGFRVASKEFGGAQGQLNTVGTMVEMGSTMKNALEDQQNITEIVQIGQELAEAQKAMGFDTQKMEQAITNIRSSVEKVNATTEILQMQMETLNTSPEGNREQESLKAELMAEMKADTATTDKLEDKIKKERDAA